MNNFYEYLTILKNWLIYSIFKSKHNGARFGMWVFSTRVMIIWIPTTLIIASIFFWIAFTGPHMKYQPHIVTYEMSISVLPKGTITVEEKPLWPVSQYNVSQNKYTFEDGEKLYNYYCVFCHGEIGKGVGPVGHSFVPRPKNLFASEIKTIDDTDLINMMYRGNYHIPLIPYVVRSDYRSSIARYIEYKNHSLTQN